jgi:hypothetical protein
MITPGTFFLYFSVGLLLGDSFPVVLSRTLLIIVARKELLVFERVNPRASLALLGLVGILWSHILSLVWV